MFSAAKPASSWAPSLCAAGESDLGTGEDLTEAVGSRSRCRCPLLSGGGPGHPGVGFPQRQPIFLRSLMEPEKENAERPPRRGRKRRQAPSQLGGAAEAMRAGWEREARLPQVKVSNGGSPTGRPGALWSPRTLAPPPGGPPAAGEARPPLGSVRREWG